MLLPEFLPSSRLARFSALSVMTKFECDVLSDGSGENVILNRLKRCRVIGIVGRAGLSWELKEGCAWY